MKRGAGIATGILIGVALGFVFRTPNMGVWIAIGVAIGAAIEVAGKRK